MRDKQLSPAVMAAWIAVIFIAAPDAKHPCGLQVPAFECAPSLSGVPQDDHAADVAQVSSNFVGGMDTIRAPTVSATA